MIRGLYTLAVERIHSSRNRSTGERLAICATGGYGRGTLAPGSDVDVLFLLPFKQTAWNESVVETLLYFLWDLGLKVGHATRSTEECLREAEKDLTIRTALLEARIIAGDIGLFQDLVTRFDKQVVRGSGGTYAQAKLEERELRLRKQGSSRYPGRAQRQGGQGRPA